MMNHPELAVLDERIAQSSADGIEAVVVEENTQELRLANNAVIQAHEVTARTLTLRVIQNGVPAVVTTNDWTNEGLDRAFAQATNIARSARRPGDYPALSSIETPAPYSAPDSLCTETLERTTEHHLEWLSPAIAESKAAGTVLAGHSRSGVRTVHFRSSAGRCRTHSTTFFDTMFIAGDPSGCSGYAGEAGTSLQGVDLTALGEKAVSDAVAGRNTVDLEPGEYDVILEPEAVSELLEWLVGIGFTSGAYEDGLSFIRGREGEPITGPNVSIFDDGWCTNGVGIPLPFDSQGEWKQPTFFIDKGIAKGIAHDRQSAARMGSTSTGHATFADDMPEGSSRPEHVQLAGGTDTHSSLLEKMDRGLWISRFHYVNGLLEPKRAVMTGLTRDGCFLMENGIRKGGVSTLRFTDSILEAFQRIDGISETVKVVPTWWSSGGAFVCPSLLIRGLRFTGKSRS